MRKFLEDVIGPLRVPSHCRYLNYFSGLLSGKIKMNSSPLYLKYVAIESPPSWMNYDSISTQSSEWRSFIKVYEGLNCVFTSGECRTENFLTEERRKTPKSKRLKTSRSHLSPEQPS